MEFRLVSRMARTPTRSELNCRADVTKIVSAYHSAYNPPTLALMPPQSPQ
jgi:hypothetical protein